MGEVGESSKGGLNTRREYEYDPGALYIAEDLPFFGDSIKIFAWMYIYKSRAMKLRTLLKSRKRLSLILLHGRALGLVIHRYLLPAA